MTSVRIISRPYTNPTIKNPTYPTVLEDHRIVEMTWEEREGKVMPKHKPEEYINIKAFYGSFGTELDLKKAQQVQQKASDEDQPLDVVLFDEQFNCWRNLSWMSPITLDRMNLWKANNKE